MADLSSARKSTIENVALSRGILPSKSKNETLSSLNRFSTPFGIDPSLPQYEKVLHMTGISNYQIAKYLTIPTKSIVSRQDLLERLFEEELNEDSVKVLDYSKLSLARLKQLSGSNTMIKADMIRKILFGKEDTGLLQTMLTTIVALKFSLIDPVPQPREIKETGKTPFSEIGAKNAISQSRDPKNMPIDLLRGIVADYLLFPRKVKDEDIIEILRDVIRYPVQTSWLKVKKYFKDKKPEDINQLANLMGYPGLDKKQLEFFFSRGYVPGIVQAKQLSEELAIVLTELYGEDYEIAIENESPNVNQWIQTFIEWDGLPIAEIIPMAHDKGVSINPLKPSYVEDIPLYINVDKYAVDLESPPELTTESLLRYSDVALIQFFPQAPYGRENLIDAFIEYWSTERYFYYNDAFYKGTLGSHVRIDEGIDYDTLGFEELMDVSFWVNVASPNILTTVLQNIKIMIQGAEIDNLPEGVPEGTGDILRALRKFASVSFGGDGAVPMEVGLVDGEAYDIEYERYRQLVTNFEDKSILDELPLIDIRSLNMSSSSTIGGILTDGLDYRAIDSANFYLMLYDDQLDDLVTMARKPEQ